MPTVMRPSGIDVSVFNPNEIIYVTGNEATDDSLRLLADETGANVEFQRRIDGVWNVTGIQIAAASILLGWSLRLQGAGEWLQTFEVVSGRSALFPHVFYTDAGTGPVHSPVLGAKIIKSIFQPDDSDEVTGTILSIDVLGEQNFLLSKGYFRVGSIGSTSPVMVTLRDGSSSGAIFWQENFPTSVFATPNSEVEIALESLVETTIGETIYVEMKSDNPISLKSDLAGLWWIAFDAFPVSAVNLLTADDGVDRFLTDINGAVVSDINGNLMLDGGPHEFS